MNSKALLTVEQMHKLSNQLLSGNFLSMKERCMLAFNISRLGDLSHWATACSVDFDGVFCWPSTTPNTTVSFPCTQASHAGNMIRHCNWIGQWEESDYSACFRKPVDEMHYLVMYYIFLVGYSVSLVVLIFTLATFFSYRTIWCLRNVIHTNLVLCFMAHNTIWVLYSVMTREFEWVDVKWPVPCTTATILLIFFTVATFFWMFVEGFFLFMMILHSFHARKVVYLHCAIVGWGIPIVLVTAHTVTKMVFTDYICWIEPPPLINYIYIVPVMIVVILNFLFLCRIMHVVMGRLQVSEVQDIHRYLKGLRALLILCPLLGLNYLLVLVHPSQPMWLNLAFKYYTTVIGASQGALVALLFCLKNIDVGNAESTRLQSANNRSQPLSSMRLHEWPQTSPRGARLSLQVSRRKCSTPMNYRNVLVLDSMGRFRSMQQESTTSLFQTKQRGPRKKAASISLVPSP